MLPLGSNDFFFPVVVARLEIGVTNYESDVSTMFTSNYSSFILFRWDAFVASGEGEIELNFNSSSSHESSKFSFLINPCLESANTEPPSFPFPPPVFLTRLS